MRSSRLLPQLDWRFPVHSRMNRPGRIIDICFEVAGTDSKYGTTSGRPSPDASVRFSPLLLKKTSRCPYARARRYRGAVASACLVPGVPSSAMRATPPPPIGLISRISVSGCEESAGPLAALYSSEFWMSGFVASFRSGGVLRASRRSGGVLRPSRRSGDVLRPSCTVAERDGPPKGKSPVLPLPEQAASKVPKNTKATMPTKRCNMTRDAPSGAVPWRATRTRVKSAKQARGCEHDPGDERGSAEKQKDVV